MLRGYQVNGDKVMQQYFNRQELQKVQDHFCTLTGLYAYCTDVEGRKITEMSGNGEGVRMIKECIPEEEFYRLFKRVSQSGLEDMIVERTEYDNIRLAAVLAQKPDKGTCCWLICCVLSNVTEGNILHMPDAGISQDAFYEALDLIAEIEKKFTSIKKDVFTGAEKGRDGNYKTEKKDISKRTGAAARLIGLLKREDSFKSLANEILSLAGEYLEISDGKLFRVTEDGNYVEEAAGFSNERHTLNPEHAGKRPRSPLVMGETNIQVSSHMLLSAGMRGELLKYHIKTIASFPVLVNGRAAFYFWFYERERERVWKAEELEFMESVVCILQEILENKIRKESYLDQQKIFCEILENVGTGVYIKDSETGECLWANRMLRKTFEDELKDRTLNMMIANAEKHMAKEGVYELCHRETGRWYDMYHMSIEWTDGRKALLYSFYDITEKQVYQKKIKQQAYTDFLTGLYNRMCCERDLAAFIDKAHKEDKKGALLYLDLDDFKHINDGLGHHYGDVLLQSVSKAFQRIEGIAGNCYRVGGDEFVVIVPPERFNSLEDIIKRIKGIFEASWYLKDDNYYCTMSMGVCIYPDDGESVADLIRKADISLYEAKRAGKNRVARYSPDLKTISGKRLDMEKSMRDATSSDCSEFNVYFQPVIDILRPGMPCMGAEALVRWNSTALGFIPPAEFIPLAEYLGLITPIGNYVLQKACRACKKWNDNGHPEYKVNVNLSVVQLLQNDIIDVIGQTLVDTGLLPSNLTLEVTESLAINDMKRMKDILGNIKKLGVRIALDDFGTGYSSLNYIREIPLDVIKVDQSFIKGIAKDEYSRSFIKMVAELASAIDVSICVEGIETKEQYKVLEDMKVRLVQGYYFDKPLPIEEFERKYVGLYS